LLLLLSAPARGGLLGGTIDRMTLGAPALVGANDHVGVSSLDCERDSKHRVTLGIRFAPGREAIWISTFNVVELRDAVVEVPGLFAEGTVGLENEASIVQRELLLLDGVDVAIFSSTFPPAIIVGCFAFFLLRLLG